LNASNFVEERRKKAQLRRIGHYKLAQFSAVCLVVGLHLVEGQAWALTRGLARRENIFKKTLALFGGSGIFTLHFAFGRFWRLMARPITVRPAGRRIDGRRRLMP
jgi:hypothetical protein